MFAQATVGAFEITVCHVYQFSIEAADLLDFSKIVFGGFIN